ncbi:hypothetical protein CISG_07868 [Coccidioides immitis RMSCC 3703]|uniref:Uncharacterized protein n=2 Tax=Coccidioides immitis TaxID=5501 RepID=A0A0J8TZL6_COCIT|nr:hypothetical protein CIRG_04275 [Coccidioides immitis RMSCC 2394]KMU79437.1 hypothetical protein CISG_07868 [Coccidioides immitis RMSCC 3703]
MSAAGQSLLQTIQLQQRSRLSIRLFHPSALRHVPIDYLAPPLRKPQDLFGTSPVLPRFGCNTKIATVRVPETIPNSSVRGPSNLVPDHPFEVCTLALESGTALLAPTEKNTLQH